MRTSGTSAAVPTRPAGVTYKSGAVLLLTLLTVSLYLWPKYLALGGGGAGVNPFYLVVFAALVYGSLSLFDGRTRPRPRLFGWLALGLFALHYGFRFFSDSQSGTPQASAYIDLRELLWSGLLLPIGLFLSNRSEALNRVAGLICGSTIVIVGIALIEFFFNATFPSLVLSYLPVNIDPVFYQALVFDKTRDGLFRAQSVFQHPLVLGEVAASSLPIVLALLLNRRRKVLPALAAICCVAGALLSGSRTAQIGLIVSVIVFVGFYVLTRRKATLWLAALVTLPVTATGGWIAYDYAVTLAEGRTYEEQQSSNHRAGMWDRSTTALAESPLIGHGAGNALQIAGVRGRTQALTIDDFYLSTLLDSGYVGLATLILMVFAVALGSIAARVPADQRALHAGFLAAICTILVCQRALSITEAMAYVMFFCGLLIASQARAWELRSNRKRPAPAEASNPVGDRFGLAAGSTR